MNTAVPVCGETLKFPNKPMGASCVWLILKSLVKSGQYSQWCFSAIIGMTVIIQKLAKNTIGSSAFLVGRKNQR